jgi:tetratricopeptide (TPR) repeat protein
LAELDRSLTDVPSNGRFGAGPFAVPGTGATVVPWVISGAGGVGKTSLALAWADRHVERFPDGQLFVDLRGFTPVGDPMAPGEAVRGFLDALGVDAGRLPRGLDAQVALYRSLVADKRMLIVLDNAVTVEQLAPLLPGGRSCTVLVTSRNRLAGLVARHGARPLLLDVLDHVEARAMVTTTLGSERVHAEEQSVRELLALCGGFPLSLAMIVARVRNNPRLQMSEVVADLREFGLEDLDHDESTASLSATLSWSLRHLTAEQRTAFALIGTAPGPDTSLPAVTSLTGLSTVRARKVLRALEDASLIDRRIRGRYAMHDVIRAYATACAHDLAEPVRRDALRRVLDFYLHTAYAAERRLDRFAVPIRLDPPASGVVPAALPDEATAMAWMDTEHPGLLAAQRAAAAHQWHSVTWQLAWTLTTFHHRRGHHHDEVAVWRVALDAATRLPDPATLVQAHRFVGRACLRLGRWDEASAHVGRALALAEQHGDSAQQAHTHRMLAMVRWKEGDYRQALDHSRRALGLYRAVGQPIGEAAGHCDVGWFAAHLGDYDTARIHCRASLALNEIHRNLDGEACAHDSLGWIDHRTGRHREAVDHYLHALSLFRGLGNTYHAADALDRLGHSLVSLGHPERARVAWSEALELYQYQGRDIDAERMRSSLETLDA